MNDVTNVSRARQMQGYRTFDWLLESGSFRTTGTCRSCWHVSAPSSTASATLTCRGYLVNEAKCDRNHVAHRQLLHSLFLPQENWRLWMRCMRNIFVTHTNILYIQFWKHMLNELFNVDALLNNQISMEG